MSFRFAQALGCLALVMVSLGLPAQAAAGGTLSPEGLTLELPASQGSLTFGIGHSGYGDFAEVGVRDSAGSRFYSRDYAQAPDAYEGLSPGSCAYADEGSSDLRCGLTPVNGEPLFITGTAGDDYFRDIGCDSIGRPPNTPCPRVFKIALGDGNDYMRMWNFAVVPAEEQDPTGNHPWLIDGWAPMHGVEISLGSGNDEVVVMGGPTSGAIDGGSGNDRIWTRGDYSDPGEPARGGYTITCGPGYDYVQPGPDDRVGEDCEQLTMGSPDEEARKGSDIASTCGVARFDFRDPAGYRGALRKGRTGCVYLVSNRFARELLKRTFNSQRNFSQTFVKVLRIAAGAAKGAAGTTDEDALNAFIQKYTKDKLGPVALAQDIITDALPKWIREGIRTAGRANPLFTIGGAVGLTAIPLWSLHRIHQIYAKGACVEFVVAVRRKKVAVDSRLVYNPAYYSDKAGTYARVHQREPGLIDSYPAKFLNLSCNAKGMVKMGLLRDTDSVFRDGHRTFAGVAG